MAHHKKDYQPEDIRFPDQAIVTSELVHEMKTSYMEYAMSVIVGRALPDVRDGLKPVHRRILYAMYEDNLTADKPFKKSATCVGDVLGRYHPHGDASVYDALVRLAQDFSMRYMLVDGHGNFGSVDGDPPAAYRYTEARLSKISNEMLRDLEKDTVDWDPNFDESRKEPRVLPSRFPNLLVNGSSGIAVGMATNIPPHNLTEAINACLCVLDNPEATLADLMEHLPGPDAGGAAIRRQPLQGALRNSDWLVHGQLPAVHCLQRQQSGHDLGETGGIELLVLVLSIDHAAGVGVHQQGSLGLDGGVRHLCGGGRTCQQGDRQDQQQKNREKAVCFHIKLLPSVV